MNNKKYKLRYLPMFYSDLERIVDYISFELNNKEAAANLIDSIEKAILHRLPVAESFEKYNSKIEREYAYYRIYVGNYIVYYVIVVESDYRIMEVRRLLYVGQNRDEIV